MRDRRGWLFAGALVVCACSKPHLAMDYYPEQRQEPASPEATGRQEPRVWPSPPEIPRYRYAGQLIGEQNFTPDAEFKPNPAERIVRWLVGLTSGGDYQPRELVRPQDGMVGPDGRVFVTDAGAQAVLVFDTAKAEVEVWRAADAAGDFYSPVGIAFGPGNQVLVADSQLARIIRLGLDGHPIGSFGQGILQRPTGLACDPVSGETYVADTAAHDIKVFDQDGGLIDTIGQRGSGPGEFNAPTHLAFAKGKLYVTDTFNNRVQVLSPDGEPLGTIGQGGLYVGNLTRPKGVTVDGDGNVYIIESYYDHLLVFSETGELLLPIGGTGAEVGKFFLPAGVWSDAQNRIYVADMFNSRVVIMQYLGE